MSDENETKPRVASKAVFGIWAVCALLVILYAVFGPLGSQEKSPAPDKAPAFTPKDGSPYSNRTDQAKNAPDKAAYPAFEETLGAPILDRVKHIDYALLQSLFLTGYGPYQITLKQVRVERFHGESYQFQALEIELDENPGRFLRSLKENLEKWAPEAALEESSGFFEITVMGRATHHLYFKKAVPKPAAVGTRGKLALVIDDLGQDLEFAKQLANLEIPITFSILPQNPKSQDIARLAKESGRETLVHLPMEPQGYPKVNPGPGALFVNMSPEELKEVLEQDLAQIPNAVGVNNHMGSRFTQDQKAMRLVLDVLREKGLFFLDSLTTPGSAASSEAEKIGLALYKRSIFLDNVRDARAILRRLYKAEDMAGRTGQAIAIGHPYPETLAALQEWTKQGHPKAKVVPLSTLKPKS
ncbi:MAG: divergent polysaccharide deacetylase family protein [Thermodesulfobacteriota bacterium]|nr:divergent polysaccharide deacetylase family protein [Thermodesulfobacteriota bacterium]